jgi:hypothetical protein
MGQVLHGSARTTEAVRRAIQHSQESLRALAKRHGINQKTVAKWKKRMAVEDLPTGPKDAHSTVLSIEDEAVIVAFRRHTLLPLDDCLYALQATIPHLTRSSLHRCLQRHGISRLPEVTGDKTPKRKFKTYPIGYFHIDIAEVQTAEGRLRLFVAIDRTSKFAFVELHQEAGKMIAARFLSNLIAAVPYTIHTVLTDNGIQFTNRTCDAYAFHHIFDRVCDENKIEHRLTKVKHPWTTDKIEQPFLATGAIFLLLTGDRAAKSRARGASPAAQPMIVAPPLRRPWARVVLACSSLRSGADTLSRPVQPGASPPGGCGSGYSHRLNHAGRVVQADLSAAPGPAASWHAALA